MTLEETTQLYASVLRQLLPTGGYDTSPNTEALAVDVYAHAKLLAQADLDAKRLLTVLEGFPPELISEYETEYGLPLKCTVNAGRTLEERIELLKWVRSTRNVLNKAYLEQILAIFGVVLIDIIKFKPLLCTAPCNSPVNTEQLRYKVFLRLQYPMNADMSCIVENYLPGYLRVEWTVDMPWGDWIFNPEVTVNTAGMAHYTAYKTNQREYYDSYANLNLTNAIIRSLHDSDMQQWQAVKDVANELTGVTDWTFDTANSRVVYTVPNYPLNIPKVWIHASDTKKYYVSADEACRNQISTGSTWKHSRVVATSIDSADCYAFPPWSPAVDMKSTGVSCINNPTYDPAGMIEKSVSFSTIAQKIISNTQNSNQAISLLAETYIETVANSIFSTDQSKQFVKQSDLLSQLELNKTLRT